MVTIASSYETRRLQSLVRHIEGVQQDCQILGTRLIERGEPETGRLLIANGFVHDHSKFEGIEWEHLGSRDDPLFEAAWQHHVHNNQHHPEFWEPLGGMPAIPRPVLAEVVVDWHVRSAELGTCLRDWISDVAEPRFHFDARDEVGKQVHEFVELLLEHWN